MKQACGFFLLFFLLGGCAVKILPPGADSQALLRPIENRLAEIRGLAFQETVPVKVVSPLEVRAILAEEMEREFPPEPLEADRKLYLALDLIQPDLDLRQTILDLYSREVAAFYDPVKNTMTVVSPIRNPLLAWQGLTRSGRQRLRQVLFSHELVHALEDQHFHFERFEYHPGANEDFLLAVQAVSEGSALLFGTLYLVREIAGQSPAMADLILERIQKRPLPLGGGRYPEVLTAPVTFSYQAGLKFIRAVYQARGLAGINALYHDPELSTELILHPEKYLAHSDLPATLELPPLLDLLPDFQFLDQNTLGEFGTALILESRLPKATATAAAAGWAGDSYALFETKPGDRGLLWYSAWDSEAEAKEFQQALASWAEQGDTRSGQGATAIYLSDRRVLLVLGFKYGNPEELARRFKLRN